MLLAVLRRLLALACCGFLALAPAACAAAPAAPAVADHSVLDALLRERVRSGLVDYAALRADARLADYLAAMAAIDPAALPEPERLAYWINTYNAVTLKLMADRWPVDSIMRINEGKPWDIPLFHPRGAAAPLTLNEMEHGIVRKQFREPRIHFALVCAAISCPPLRAEAYAAARLEAQLEEQTTNFLRDPANNRYDAATHTLTLSPLFDWYAVDFGGVAGAPGYALRYFTEADRAAIAKKKAAPKVTFANYDWAPNAQR